MVSRTVATHLEGRTKPSEQALRLAQLEHGWLGRFFGKSGHMIYYIAILCVLLSAAAFFWGGPAGSPYATSVLTFAGGLIGGRGFKQ